MIATTEASYSVETCVKNLSSSSSEVYTHSAIKDEVTGKINHLQDIGKTARYHKHLSLSRVCLDNVVTEVHHFTRKHKNNEEKY